MDSGIEKQEFIDLFRQMHKPVKNYIYYKTGDIDLADDLAQDVFLKAWEIRAKIRMETVRSLLYTIAGNLCKNRFDHQRVVFEFASKFEQNERPASPEFELELKEFHYKLQNAVATLSEKNRVVFLMNRVDGYTFKEIAENLGLSIKAVEKRMKNALTDLKKTIEHKI